MKLKPYSGAGVAIFKWVDGDCCVLLCKRRFHPFKGYWTFPSGKQEHDEAPIVTALRVAHDELRVYLNLRGWRVGISLKIRIPFFKWETFFFETGDLKISKKAVNKKFTNYKWISVRSLSNYKLYPYVLKAVLHYLSYKAKGKPTTI